MVAGRIRAQDGLPRQRPPRLDLAKAHGQPGQVQDQVDVDRWERGGVADELLQQLDLDGSDLPTLVEQEKIQPVR